MRDCADPFKSSSLGVTGLRRFLLRANSVSMRHIWMHDETCQTKIRNCALTCPIIVFEIFFNFFPIDRKPLHEFICMNRIASDSLHKCVVRFLWLSLGFQDVDFLLMNTYVHNYNWDFELLSFIRNVIVIQCCYLISFKYLLWLQK